MEMELQNQAMGYDRTATMFSPDGRLLQVEYAEKTVRLGSASIGIVCSDGVVIVSDKRVTDTLLLPEVSLKIWEIDNHVMATAAGILSDARVLMERAQIVAQQHRVTYDEPVDVEAVMKDIANQKQLFTQYGGARPFGVEVMVLGVDPNNGCKLFVSDVTGNYFGYKATAIGENDEKIKELLRASYKDSISIEQGIKLSFNIFKKVLGKTFDISRFEMALINKSDKKIKKMYGTSLSKYIK